MRKYPSESLIVEAKKVSVTNSKNDFIIQILSLARARVGEINGGIMITSFNGFPLLENTLERLYLENTGSQESVLWWEASLQSGVVKSKALEKALQSLLNRKFESGRNCAKTEGLNILVIYASKDLLGSRVLEIFTPPKFSNCPFDYVYFWEDFGETINELYPARKTILSWDNDGPILFLKNLPLAFK